MNQVFLDTVGLLAIWDDADQWHEAAQAAFQRLQQDCRPLVTTELVLYECGNAAARRPYRSDVSELRDSLANEGLLIELTVDEIRQGWTAYGRGNPHDPGIVDCLSFIAMRRLGITEAFTNDRHFREAGFETLF